MALSPRRFEPARLIVIMGVSSSGKTALGEAVSRRLHAPFLDGDDFHPAANVEKMRAGTPLTDEDRWPWLHALATGLHEAAASKGVAVGACSALRRIYRDFLIETAREAILFVHLAGPKPVIAERIARRQHRFMPASLLDSQFATLESPAPDENAVTLDVTEPVETLAGRVIVAVPHLKAFKRGQ